MQIKKPHYIKNTVHGLGTWKNDHLLVTDSKNPKPTLLCFWRSHTPESIEALHDLQLLQNRYTDSLPFVIVGIHAPEFISHEDPWEAVLQQFNISFPVFHDPHYHVWERYNVQHAPFYIVIDHEGREQVRRAGSVSDSGILDFMQIAG